MQQQQFILNLTSCAQQAADIRAKLLHSIKKLNDTLRQNLIPSLPNPYPVLQHQSTKQPVVSTGVQVTKSHEEGSQMFSMSH